MSKMFYYDKKTCFIMLEKAFYIGEICWITKPDKIASTILQVALQE